MVVKKKPYVCMKELISCMIFLSKRKTKFKIYLYLNDIGVKVRKTNKWSRYLNLKKNLEKPVMVGRVTFQIIITMYQDS